VAHSWSGDTTEPRRLAGLPAETSALMRRRSTHVQKNQLRIAPIDVSAYCSICSRVRRVQSEASDQ